VTAGISFILRKPFQKKPVATRNFAGDGLASYLISVACSSTNYGNSTVALHDRGEDAWRAISGQ